MAQTTFAQATPTDLADIPTYVVHPHRGSASRYHAPRLSRATLSLKELRELQQASLGQRVLDSWRKHRGNEPTEVECDPVGELRYRSTPNTPMFELVSRVPAAKWTKPEAAATPRSWPLGRCVAAACLCLAAGALGWVSGTQIQPAAASSQRAIPASVLIAGQNMPTKLPSIEHKAAIAGALEKGHRLGRLTYVVQAGDTFRSVGQRFGLTAETIRLVNQLPVRAVLKGSQHLMVTPEDGVMVTCADGDTFETLAKRYGLVASALAVANPDVKSTDKLKAGLNLFVPGAQEVLAPPAAPQEDGTRGYRNDRNEGTFGARLTASRSLIGEFGNRVGTLSWPAAGQISSPFGVRGFSFHPGMDICNAVGTPVHAAKAGTVLSAGWYGGYGYAVDIDHGGGIVTRYGHCSRLLVTAGQKVQSGDEIALMGSTGFSTGPHVHFEVRIQGRAVNPASFL